MMVTIGNAPLFFICLHSLPYPSRLCHYQKPDVLHADVQPPVPVEPGQPKRVDYEYERRGTLNLFVMVEPLAGWRHVEVTAQRTMHDYAKIVRWLVDEVYPHASSIRLVQDMPPHAYACVALRNLFSCVSSAAFSNDWNFMTPRSMAAG
jgi:hypothetical protein